MPRSVPLVVALALAAVAAPRARAGDVVVLPTSAGGFGLYGAAPRTADVVVVELGADEASAVPAASTPASDVRADVAAEQGSSTTRAHPDTATSTRAHAASSTPGRAATGASTASSRKAAAAAAKAASDAAFIRLVTDAPGAHITSDYGGRVDPMGDHWSGHHAVDIAAPIGAPIFAAADGVVTIATYDSGCGFMVEIAHATGLRSRYCHAASLLVEQGERVTKGQTIATVGATGEATGAHLHFEVRAKNGAPVDPHVAVRRHLLG